MDLKTINEQPDGFCPPEVAVKIAKVWERKSGTNDTGDWSFQNVDVDQGGTKATLKLKNLPEFPNTRVGQTVTIRANKSDTHGLTGIKTETREYNGKSYKSIVITPSGKWEWGAATSNGSGAAHTASSPAQSGALNETTYTDHLLSCAELAAVIGSHLSLDDAQALQACFATICIDTKNRGLLLPRPKTLPAASPAQSDLNDEPYGEPPPGDFSEEDIPF